VLICGFRDVVHNSEDDDASLESLKEKRPLCAFFNVHQEGLILGCVLYGGHVD